MCSDRRQLLIGIKKINNGEHGQIVYGPMTPSEVETESGWRTALKAVLHPDDKQDRAFVSRMFSLAYRKWTVMEQKSKVMWDKFLRPKVFIAVSERTKTPMNTDDNPFALPHCEETVRGEMIEGAFYKYGPLFSRNGTEFLVTGYMRRHVVFDFIAWLDHFQEWLEPGKECGK